MSPGLLKDTSFPNCFETSAILKMLLSAVCGGSIGLGREIHRRSTFSIVCLGSTLIMVAN